MHVESIHVININIKQNRRPNLIIGFIWQRYDIDVDNGGNEVIGLTETRVFSGITMSMNAWYLSQRKQKKTQMQYSIFCMFLEQIEIEICQVFEKQSK